MLSRYVLTFSDCQILIKSCSIDSRNDTSPKSEVVHGRSYLLSCGPWWLLCNIYIKRLTSWQPKVTQSFHSVCKLEDSCALQGPSAQSSQGERWHPVKYHQRSVSEVAEHLPGGVSITGDRIHHQGASSEVRSAFWAVDNWNGYSRVLKVVFQTVLWASQAVHWWVRID